MALSEVVDRLRESLAWIEGERCEMERNALDLLEPGLDLGPLAEQPLAADRYRDLLAAELQGANLALEELVVNLREVLGKRFLSRFVKRAQADLAEKRVDRDHRTARNRS